MDNKLIIKEFRSPKVKTDEDGLIEENSPCWDCENAYVEDIWLEWMCKAKKCPYEKEGGTDG